MNSRACCYSSVIESDSFILFMRGGFHRTWQRFQGETSIFRIPTMSLPLTHSINFWAHYAVNSGNVYSILLSINHRLHTKRSIQDLLFLKGQSVWKKKMCAQSNAFIIFVIMVCKSKLLFEMMQSLLPWLYNKKYLLSTFWVSFAFLTKTRKNEFTSVNIKWKIPN